MSGDLKGFGVEVVKIAASENERKKRPSYLRQMGAALPFAVGGAVADLPKGIAEEGVASSVQHGPRKALRSGGTALRRGVGRAGGRLLAGSVTSPLFLSGLKDIKEGDTKRGTAKVVGAGTAFSALKGGIEAAGMGGSKKKLIKSIKNLAGARAATGALGAALTANAVGRSLRSPKKDEKKKKKTGLGRYALPAAVGAATGVPEGAFEEAWKHKGKGFRAKIKTPSVRSAMKGRAAGKAVAGAMGAVAVTELARRFLSKPKGKQKHAKVELPQVPGPSDVYRDARGWAQAAKDDDLVGQYEAAWEKGEETPSSRALLYAMHDELSKRGAKKLRKLKVRPHLRHEVVSTPAPSSAEAIALLGVASSPVIFFRAVVGRMKTSDKDYAVRDVLERMTDNKGIIRRIHKGDAPVGYFTRSGQGAKFVGYGEKTRPSILAHELGHATAGKLRAKTLQNPHVLGVSRAGQLLSTLMPMAMTMSMSDKSFTTADELESKANLISSLGKVTTLAQAPLLAEEALATAKGLGYLSRAGGSKVRGLKTLLPAYATYAMPAAFPFLTSAYLRRKARRARKKESE